MINQNKIVFFIIVTLITVGVQVGLVSFASHGFPVLEWTSVEHALPALALKSGYGLVNPVTQNRALVPDGKHYSAYPPFWPILLSSLMWEPTPQNLMLMVSIINALSLLICAVLFLTIVCKRSAFNWKNLFWIAACLGGMAAIFSYHLRGRAEVLTTFLLAVGLLAYEIESDKIYVPLWGFLLGCMAATQPMAAVCAVCLAGMGMSVKKRNPISRLLLCYVIAGLVFLSLMRMSPYGTWETLSNIAHHARTAYGIPLFSRIQARGFLNMLVLRPQNPLYGILMLLIVPVGVLEAVHLCRHMTFISRLVFSACFIMLSMTVIFFSFCNGEENSAVWLSPLFLSRALSFMLGWQNQKWLKGILAIPLIVLAGGFIRVALMYPFYLRDGMSLFLAREKFMEFKKTQPAGTVFDMSCSLWVLSEDYYHMRHLVDGGIKDLKSGRHSFAGVEVYCLQQNYEGVDSLTPPELNGLTLVKNYFSSGMPRIFGIPLARSTPGYGFAIYTKQKVARRI